MTRQVTAQEIVAEALSWVGTPFAHQQPHKGVGVDCANFIREVAVATRATPNVDFEANYRRREDGTQMLLELVRYMEPVERFEDALPADVLALHDGRAKDTPRHLAFLTQLEPYPKMAHASERGVVHHRIDLNFRRRIHSIWRVPGLNYADINTPTSPRSADKATSGPSDPVSGDSLASGRHEKSTRAGRRQPQRQQ